MSLKQAFKKFNFTDELSILGYNRWRNNRLEVFCEKDALRNFAKFTLKHQCQWLFLNKVVDLRPANLLKKSLCMRLLRGSFL